MMPKNTTKSNSATKQNDGWIKHVNIECLKPMSREEWERRKNSAKKGKS